MPKVGENLTIRTRPASIDQKARKSKSPAPSQPAGTPKQRKTMSRETFEALLRLSDDGCPLVVDLEEYDIVEAGSHQSDKLGH